VAILPPYVFSGAYALKLALSGETYEREPSRQKLDILLGALATLYGLWLCYAADLKYLLLATILFAPGSLLYMNARREHRQRMFTGVELAIALALTAAALFAIYQLIVGGISI
jgi:arginine:ornithine antiporter/lysine permease